MPRVKIDYVVSFSSEDPDNQASNLLAWDISKKKWLCCKGELSCSVVLQLAKAVKIESINIGAHHAALVEVLVGLSEKPNDPYQVLVPNSVLLTPAESRRDDGIEKVRSFSGAQLSSEARGRRWDRIRVVCSQPYNKHCKFGLSFIHIFEPEEASRTVSLAVPSPSPAVPSRLLQLETYSSDEDEFKPGELFAQSQNEKTSSSTDAQIRQASSQALKNISDSATKLLKTPISKNNSNKDQNRVDDERSNRKKDSLMYNDDDDQPHAKIDRVVERHKETKEKQSKEKQTPQKDDNSANSSNRLIKDGNNENRSSEKNKLRDSKKKTPNKKNDSHNDTNASQKKRKRSEDTSNALKPGPICSSPGDVLKGVEFALSGYVNPRRAALRTSAMALGAWYRPDWQPSCTHLICAFPNTPKLKSVRASKAGTVAVTGEWVEACSRLRRLLPWQWFATEPHLRVAPPAGWDRVQEDKGEEEMDTDDEIEKVLKQQRKKRKNSPSPDSRNTEELKEGDTYNKTPANEENVSEDNKDQSQDFVDDANVSRDSDIAFVKDERIKDNIIIFESDSDTEEDTREIDEDTEDGKELPSFFDGCTFLIAAELKGGYDRAMLERYVRAYGGLVLQEDELLEESTVDYCIGYSEKSRKTALCVKPEWIWKCHEASKRVDTEPYLI